METLVDKIALGPNSPLRRQTPKQRLGFSESQMQCAAIELLVGNRRTTFGMTERHPALALLYAIPNQRSSKGEAKRMKGEGSLKGVPDLCFPVPVYGENGEIRYTALYVEVKLPGEKPRPDQQVVINALRYYGNAVVVCRSVEAIVEACTTWATGHIRPAAALLVKYES